MPDDLRLVEDKTVTIDDNAYTFASNVRIYFYDNGVVRRGVLASNHEVTLNEVAYTFIEAEFDSNTGAFIGGLTTDGNRYFRTVGGVHYVFTSVVTGDEGVLAEDKTVTIDSNNYTFASNEAISFYPDGSVKRGRLATNHAVTLNEVDYTFREVEFDPNTGAFIGGETTDGSNPILSHVRWRGLRLHVCGDGRRRHSCRRKNGHYR